MNPIDGFHRKMIEARKNNERNRVKVRDEKKWNEYVTANTSPYGKCCVDYAKAWAELMEEKIAAGAKLEDIAKSASHEVDQRPGFGITGFMYGCAVAMLAYCWENGEALRRWHNHDCQIGNEGDKANEEPGAILNPAILCIR